LMPNVLFCKNLVPPGKSAANPKILGRFLTSFRRANIGALIPRPTKPRQGPDGGARLSNWKVTHSQATSRIFRGK
jgi:hypothetical protein